MPKRVSSRRRPASTKRGPGPLERKKRNLATPDIKPEGITIFKEAEKPSEFSADASLAASVKRSRGLPVELAQLAYEAAQRLLRDPELGAFGISKIASGISQLAKIDIDTGRYQVGEPAGTINVNQNDNKQVKELSPRQMMEAYAATVRNQVEAAYEQPSVNLEAVTTNGNGHHEEQQ